MENAAECLAERADVCSNVGRIEIIQIPDTGDGIAAP
jgi:hypothetical protein